ncbi:MAG: phosphoesterase [Bacteroidetes bacterium QS_8_64_10]|jgi:predicted metal-dependent phosphoesterase TrpH|nr:MAG: phosphoesterase [Bacteroidetes bacterium QS_8_64_10]
MPTPPDAPLADLHAHTSCSDGRLTPAALVRKAEEHGLRALAVTDHDTVAGLDEARATSVNCELHVIAGVELSVTVDGEELHLLGYFFEINHPRLREALGRMRDGRRRRAKAMVKRLREKGVTLSFEAVEEQARDASAIGRPHVAAALAAGGHVASHQEAFDRYLHDGGPAFVRKSRFPIREALAALHDAGGIGVLAHPGQHTSTERVERLAKAGLDGLEVHHPSHPPHLAQYYEREARRLDLIPTGGSDYHGHRKRDEQRLGQYGIPHEQLRKSEFGVPSLEC